MTSKQEGLFGKYLIRKSDGTPLSVDAKYFVIRYDKASASANAAREALETYCDEIDYHRGKYYNPTLASELRANLKTYGVELGRPL